MQKPATAVYFYGFPKKDVTSNQIRQKIIDKTGIDIKNNAPQIRRDINKPEWNAVVKLETAEDHKNVLEKMRFFRWPQDDSNIEIRTLAYDPEVKQREQPEIMAKNVFCRVLPANMSHSDLFNKLSNYANPGEIKSVKVSIDPDSQKSRKYGFVSFTTKEAAQRVFEKAEKDGFLANIAKNKLVGALGLVGQETLENSFSTFVNDEFQSGLKGFFKTEKKDIIILFGENQEEPVQSLFYQAELKAGQRKLINDELVSAKKELEEACQEAALGLLSKANQEAVKGFFSKEEFKAAEDQLKDAKKEAEKIERIEAQKRAEKKKAAEAKLKEAQREFEEAQQKVESKECEEAELEAAKIKLEKVEKEIERIKRSEAVEVEDIMLPVEDNQGNIMSFLDETKMRAALGLVSKANREAARRKYVRTKLKVALGLISKDKQEAFLEQLPEDELESTLGLVEQKQLNAALKLLAYAEYQVKFHEYHPKSKAEMRKVFNNVIVKGFQQDLSKIDTPGYIEDRKAYLARMFEKFGQFQSVFVQKVISKKLEAPRKLLAFVCFTDPDTAAKAVDEMHQKDVDGHTLYVAEALKKQQLAKEIFKFKNAKKRCNLFVKGFPQDTDEDKLTEFFEGLTHSGAIENIKLEMDKNDPTKARYAFVCFKSPDLANQVKQHIANNPQQMLGGSRLFVNNYEPKETRMIQQAEARDRADYANATSQVNGNISQVDQLFQKPELVQTLMFIMQHLQSQGRPMGGRGGHIRQAGPPRGNFQGAPQMGRQPYVHNRPQPQMQQMPRPMPQAMPPMGQMPHPGMYVGMPPMQAQMNQNPFAFSYMSTVNPIIPGVVESNENAKEIVGEKIYEFVVALAGEQHAPKITGMLIDLPLEEIRDYLQDYHKFEKKVQQAKTLLSSQ